MVIRVVESDHVIIDHESISPDSIALPVVIIAHDNRAPDSTDHDIASRGTVLLTLCFAIREVLRDAKLEEISSASCLFFIRNAPYAMRNKRDVTKIIDNNLFMKY